MLSGGFKHVCRVGGASSTAVMDCGCQGEKHAEKQAFAGVFAGISRRRNVMR
jgi:hypothetical protein